ncbi:MAG: hypothetical protein KDA52_05455 [Planctomycetaceae bacterium]|nr:hypothetical protein [Planctomycetaceae bacterium]
MSDAVSNATYGPLTKAAYYSGLSAGEANEATQEQLQQLKPCEAAPFGQQKVDETKKDALNIVPLKQSGSMLRADYVVQKLVRSGHDELLARWSLWELIHDGKLHICQTSDSLRRPWFAYHLTTADDALVQTEAKSDGGDDTESVDREHGGDNQSNDGTNATFEFRRDGDGFFVSAFGEAGHIKFLKGIEQILRLITAPNHAVSMVELHGCHSKQSPVDDSFSPQPALDSEALENVYARLRVLEDEHERAKSSNNTVDADQCWDEMERLRAELKSQTALKGKVRDLNNPADRMRPAIHGCLKRAYKLLRQSGMREVADHFESSIQSEDMTFVYRPSADGPDWSA